MTSPADVTDDIQSNIITLSKESCVSSIGPSLSQALLKERVCDCVCVLLHVAFSED